MASILGWFAISSSSVSYFVRTLCYDPSILGGPAWHGSQLHWVTQAPSPWQVIHEGEKCWRDQEKIERIRERWRWSPSVVSSSLQPHGLEPIRLLHPWNFPGKSIGVGCHFLLQEYMKELYKRTLMNRTTTMVWLVTQSQTFWSMKTSGP